MRTADQMAGRKLIPALNLQGEEQKKEQEKY
jgi:hypothetical protein